MLRLSRMAKLLRAIPELVIIVKGIGFASRSVGVFLMLWLMIIFVFSIVLRQFSADIALGQHEFQSVPHSMKTLLLTGILPDQMQLLDDVFAWPGIWLICLAFFLLASVTIMYMLVGVLVEVMTAISSTEKEGMTVSFVARQLREVMALNNFSTELSLSQADVTKLLVVPDVARIIGEVGADVGVLMDMLDIVFEDLQKKEVQGLSFEGLVDWVLNMRGHNTATVKDVKELMRIMKALVKEGQGALHKRMQDEFSAVRSELKFLREDALKRDGEEDEGLEDSDEEGEAKEAASKNAKPPKAVLSDAEEEDEWGPLAD